MIEILEEQIHFLFLLLIVILLSSAVIALLLGMYGYITETIEEIKEITK